jgi:hypothetical protein
MLMQRSRQHSMGEAPVPPVPLHTTLDLLYALYMLHHTIPAHCRACQTYEIVTEYRQTLCLYVLQVAQNSDVLFVSVKPQYVQQVLTDARPGMTSSTLIISIAAGITGALQV